MDARASKIQIFNTDTTTAKFIAFEFWQYF